MGKYSVGRDIQPQIERDMDRREFLKKVLKYTAVAGPIAIVGVHSIYHNLDDIASALNPKKTIERDKKERERKIQADMQKLVWKPRVVQKEEGLDTYSWDFLNHHPASALEEVGYLKTLSTYPR